MKVTTESSSAVEVILNVEMDASDEDPYIDRSYRRTVGRLNIPGFRKGKAPRSIVESYVGRIALVQEALDFMVPETLNQALQDEDIQAFVEPRVEILELEPVSFKAIIPLEPTVDLGGFYDVRLEKDAVAISDEEVDQVLERIRREMAPWEPVTRPVQFGDLLNLNVRGEMDGAEVVNDQEVDYIPETTNVLPFPGFAEHLENMEEGGQKDFTVTIPEDYPRPEYAGKDVAFNVEVISVKEKALADLDDEFAKGVGEGFDDLPALRSHILERITGEAESQADYAFPGTEHELPPGKRHHHRLRHPAGAGNSEYAGRARADAAQPAPGPGYLPQLRRQDRRGVPGRTPPHRRRPPQPNAGGPQAGPGRGPGSLSRGNPGRD